MAFPQFETPDNLKRFLLQLDRIGQSPEIDPFICLARTQRRIVNWPGLSKPIAEVILVKAYLVPVEHKEAVAGKLQFDSLQSGYDSMDYFEDGEYHTGEVFSPLMHSKMRFEHIVRPRDFEGLDMFYYEPMDRLISYLRLHRKETVREWINPWTTDLIIKTGDGKGGWGPHDEYIAIRKSELVDYLAARKCGLFIARYSDRALEIDLELTGLPVSTRRQTKHGRLEWFSGGLPSKHDGLTYLSHLWESYWIDPAKVPRRWDSRLDGEFKTGVDFTLHNGELGTYGEGGEHYSEVLSFNGSGIRELSKKPNTLLEFTSLTNCILWFHDNSYLAGAINRAGQFQAFFGLVAKLDLDLQRKLAAYSQPEMAKLSPELIDLQINAKYPDTRSLGWSLRASVEELNKPWKDKFDETLLELPSDESFVDILGPTGADMLSVADVMLEVRKALVPEGNIKKIKAGLDMRGSLKQDEYANMKSIGYLRLLFQKWHGTDDSTKVLSTINELRQVKGHPKSIAETLEKWQLSTDSPRAAFVSIIRRLAQFLLDFKALTEKALSTCVGSSGREIHDDPWQQLALIIKYCDEVE